MPEKLLTLYEVSAHLNIPQRIVRKLVEDGIVPAYKIGGSFLRFRLAQIDAIKDEITAIAAQLGDNNTKIAPKEAPAETVESIVETTESMEDKIKDFIYFNDFYIVSIAVIMFLLFLIFRM